MQISIIQVNILIYEVIILVHVVWCLITKSGFISFILKITQ